MRLVERARPGALATRSGSTPARPRCAGSTRSGSTGVHEMLGSPRMYDDVEALEARGDLTVRSIVPLLMQPDVTDEEIDALLAHSGRHGRRWRGGVAKFFIDGVIDSGHRVAVRGRPEGRRDRAVLARPRPLRRGRRPLRPRRAAVRDARDRRPRGRRRARRLPRRGGRRTRGPRPPRTASSTWRRCATSELARLAPEGVAASMQPLHAAGLDEPGPFNWRDNLQPAPGRQRLPLGRRPPQRRDPLARLGLARRERRSAPRPGLGAPAPRARPPGAHAVHARPGAHAARGARGLHDRGGPRRRRGRT